MAVRCRNERENLQKPHSQSIILVGFADMYIFITSTHLTILVYANHAYFNHNIIDYFK